MTATELLQFDTKDTGQVSVTKKHTSVGKLGIERLHTVELLEFSCLQKWIITTN